MFYIPESIRLEDMAGPSLENWVADLGLQEVHDPDVEKPVYRKPFEGSVPLSAELEDKIGSSIRDARDKRKLPRSKIAPLLGLSDQVYQRYETGASRLTVGRFIHICEVLRATPEELLAPAAPQLWGETDEQSDLLRANIDIMRHLDTETLTLVHSFISKLGDQAQSNQR